MNLISKIQNSPVSLQRLGAQRRLYAKAKKVFGWHFMVSVPLAVVLGLAAIANPAIKEFVASWAIIVVLADCIWLTHWQKRLRESAAKIQEIFDCDVFQLKWNKLKAGDQPDPELIKEQADLYEIDREKMPPLENWYPISSGTLPLYLARLICQRSNCWWDSKQRRNYAERILLSVTGISLLVFLYALKGGLTLSDFVLQVCAPMFPVLIFGIRQFTEQRDSANRLEKLKNHAEATWKNALESGESNSASESRNLQDEIFENRKKTTSVLDILFSRLRDDYEAQMNYSSEHYVKEAKQTLKNRNIASHQSE